MNILGIFDGQHDSGACVIRDGSLVSAVDEERLSRVKMQGGFPYRSIRECLRIAGLSESDIDAVVISSVLTPPLFARLFRSVQKKEAGVLAEKKKGLTESLSSFVKYTLKATVVSPESFLGRLQIPLVRYAIRRDLPRGLCDKPLYLVNHHLSHAASAFFGSGRRQALAVIADCWGDGLSFSVYSCKGTSMKRIYTIDAMDSFGHFYASVTKFLGFKPFRHEGKVLGLAAHGDPKNVDIPFPFVRRGGRPRFVLKKQLDPDPNLARKLARHRREDVAAWLQENMRAWIVSIIEHFVRKTKHQHIVLAGGVFANVRFNQSIYEIAGVRSVFIFPNMGDAGLAVGGALLIANKERRVSERMENVYLGPSYADDEIEDELRKAKLSYKKYASVEKEVARLLAKGHVVARFHGRMEYGPRALGNRSILYQATDPSVNDWLNKRLARTEFMPFAPATLIEDAYECYHEVQGGEFAARFMTITFDCTASMKKRCPATVHVDGTARPQLVNKQENPGFYEILREYKRLTGLPSLINTSFNMHEEPIVCTPCDAIRAFLLGHLDYLSIGSFVVKNPGHDASSSKAAKKQNNLKFQE